MKNTVNTNNPAGDGTPSAPHLAAQATRPATIFGRRGELNRNSWDGVNRRASEDRRQYTTSTLLRSIASPRRFNGRRREDRRFPVMDRFDSGMAFLAIGLMVVSILDSFFTLTLISHGGEELNPFMNWFLQKSTALFVAVKMALTAIPAIILVATGNLLLFRKLRPRSILAGLLGMYCGLIMYELALLSQIPQL